MKYTFWKRILSGLLTGALLFQSATVFSAAAAATAESGVYAAATELAIVTEPKSVRAEKGTKATVKVVASGTGLTYKWYFKNPGATKYSLTTSFTGNTYTIEMNEERSGRYVYCIVTDAYGNSVRTKTVSLSLKTPLKITKQPQSVFLNEGSNAWIYVGAEGDGLRYTWQYSDDFGATWKQSTIATAAYTTKATAGCHGRMVRCVVKDAYGTSVTTASALLLIESLLNVAITQQPNDVVAAVGDAVEFCVAAEGIGLRYMWQYSTDGTVWSDLGVAESTCSFTATASMFGRSYRCKVWDDYGHSTISDAVRLTKTSELILAQPKNWVGCASGKAFFEVEVSDSVVSCRWQISSNNGAGWSDSSVTDPYYPITASADKNGWLYRCVVRDAAGREQVSNAVSLTVTGAFSIAAQPTDVYANFNQSVPFTMQAGGTNVRFEWQRSNDGNTWETVVTNNARLPQTLQLYNVGRYYRCVVTNGDGRTLIGKTVQFRWTSAGFFTDAGKTYYVKDDGRLAIGFENIDGKLYYFNNSGVMLTGYRTLNGKMYFFGRDGAAAKGFTYVHDVCATLYFGQDGAAVTGWQTIGSNTYYFNEDTGAMAWGVTQIGENEYFFDRETGAQTFGLVKIGLNDYMYFEEGADTSYTGLKTIGGKLYYFAEDGSKLRGVAQGSMQTVGGKTYYFDPETKQAVSGRITYNDNTYFMGSDYALMTDRFVKSGTKTYLVNAKGVLCYGLVTYQNKQYYLDPTTGAAVSGWVNLDGSKMYFDPSTYAAKTGFCTVDGVKYYFSAYGYLQTGVREIGGVRYYCADQGKPKTGFVDINKNIYYVYANQKVATGLTTISGKQYYFGTDGIMKTGFKTIGSKRYYFDPDTGEARTGLLQMSNSYTYYFKGSAGTGSGLTKIGDHLYCLDSSGIVRYGRIALDGQYYYFDPATGKALSGWQSIQGSNNTVRKAYFDPKTYRAVKGLKTIGGKLYYFDSAGWVKSNMQKVNGVMYYFSPGTYEAYTGWYKNTDNTYSYFDGANGRLMGPGLFEIGGVKYYIDAYGRRKTGIQTVGGVKMYFDPVTAQAVSGFVVNNGKLYYFDGLKGVKTGVQTIGGNRYYFDNSGVAKSGLQTVGKVKYYFDETVGVRKDGLIREPKNGKYYLFDKGSSTGVKTSKATVGGVLYVPTASGTLRTGFCHKSISKLSYHVYLDTTTGEQQLGLIRFKNSAGQTVSYYFKKNGCLTSVTTVNKALNKALKTNGWHTIEGVKYYVKDGAFLKGKKTVGGKTYYFSSLTGAMLTGLRRIGNNRYYFDPSTGVMKTGLVTIGGKRFYFDPSTGVQAMGLKKIGESYYYFTENGALTGTVQKGDAQYVFGDTGAGKKAAAAKKTAAPVQAKYAAVWRTVDGVKCFYNMNGKRVTGLQTIDNKLYYFDSNGAMKTGRIKVNGSYYYFTSSGAKSGKVTISNKEYYFSPVSLTMLTGMRKIGSTVCYYNESGVKQSGWVTTGTGDRLYVTDSGKKTGLATVGGKTYYFGTDGVMRTGTQQVTTSTGTMTCSFNSSGVMVTGLVKSSSGFYYYYDPKTGARVTGFAQVGGKEYYFDPATGRAKTGFCNINGVYCYFNTSNAQRQYGLQTVKGNLRYFADNAQGYVTGLRSVGGKTYYFHDTKGIALTGYQIVDDVKYYFDPATGASVSGIYRVSGEQAHCFKAGGGIKTGWVDTNGKTYFFYPATGRMAQGLSSVGDYLYYFDVDKGLLRNTTVTVGGVSYQLDANGHGKAVGESVLAKLINTGIDNFDKGYGNEKDMENPDRFTCSQLVMYAYESIGVDLMRRPPRQYYMLTNGVYDSKIINDIREAKAGDIMFFITTDCRYGKTCDFENEIHHVGIYLGDGKILESYEIEGDSINNGPMIRDVEDGLWSAVVFGLVRINGVND